MDKTFRDYLRSTKDDWNYITPIDFYNKYYSKPQAARSTGNYYLLDLRSKAEYNREDILKVLKISTG